MTRLILLGLLIAGPCFGQTLCNDNGQPQLQGIYPRTWMYSEILSNGTPFRSGSTLLTDSIDTQAKWANVAIDVIGSRVPSGSIGNSGVVQRIRTQNPTIRLLAFSAGQTLFKCTTGWWWDAGTGWSWDANGFPGGSSGCETTGTDFSWARLRAVRQNNAILYSLTRDRNNDTRKDAFCIGSDANGHCNATPQIDFAMAGVSQALADTIAVWAKELSGVYNGVFVDEICRSLAFYNDDTGSSPKDSIDYSHSGQASLSAWDVAYKAGVASFFARLKSQLPQDWVIVGNCGAVGATRSINGWMRENFPSQNGETWSSNMLGPAPGVSDDVGYLRDAAAYDKPSFSVLSAIRATTSTPQADLEAQRVHRFVLGSATLSDGVGGITNTSLDTFRGYLPWWADEFSVKPTGSSSDSTTYCGWLGWPLGTYRVVGSGYRRNFRGGCVLVNPTGSAITFPFPAYEGQYYRIRGTVCPTVNTGAAVSGTISVPANDAIFLQKRPY